MLIQLSISLIIFVVTVSSYPSDHITFQPIRVDWDKFYGKWYEFARVDHKLEAGLSCVTFDFVAGTSYLNGHPYEQVAFDDELNQYFNVANVELNEGEAILDYGRDNYLYSVIDTDYENYAIVIAFDLIDSSNNQISSLTKKIVWILSRTTNLNETIKTQIYQKLADYSIDKDQLTINDPTKCPEY
ncbi:apolipoprotein D-like [Panonychus citri]|uniref:apolipoprotein D-like n=1 Tax=Panonychus citri TaxID=50023 RepID=UPI002306FD14|nr:apolipoprotein D-like [Panonychus citri]